jgi:hypothetical protein
MVACFSASIPLAPSRRGFAPPSKGLKDDDWITGFASTPGLGVTANDCSVSMRLKIGQVTWHMPARRAVSCSRSSLCFCALGSGAGARKAELRGERMTRKLQRGG